MFAIGPMEFLTILILGLGDLIPLLGLPPGDRDTKLVQCAPSDTVLYAEWTERSEGKERASGLEGFVADPEVKVFFSSADRAIVGSIEREMERGSTEAKEVGLAVFSLLKAIAARPGCYFVGSNPLPMNTTSPQPNWLAFLGTFRAALVVNGGPKSEKIDESIRTLLKIGLGAVDAPDLEKLALPLPLPVSVMLHRHGDYFILGVGNVTVDAVVEGLEGKTVGLAGDERFRRAVRRVELTRMGSLFWIDLEKVTKVVSLVLGGQAKVFEEMRSALGLDEFEYLISSTGLENGRILSRNFLATGGKQNGLLAFFSGRAIEPEDFDHVPADADLVLAFSFDGISSLGELKKITAAIDPDVKQALDQFLERIDRELDSKLQEDLLASLGDVWVVYDAPSQGGGLLATGLVASVEVRDPQKASKTFGSLVESIRSALPGETSSSYRRKGIFLKSASFSGQQIHYLNIIGDDVPFAPALCLTKSHLLVAAHPQTLKSHLRAILEEGEESFRFRLDQDFALPEGELLGFCYLELDQFVRFLPYVGQLIISELQSNGVDIDIFALPSAKAILPYFDGLSSTVVRTPDGILFEQTCGRMFARLPDRTGNGR